jgi:hypothetical protein
VDGISLHARSVRILKDLHGWNFIHDFPAMKATGYMKIADRVT